MQKKQPAFRILESRGSQLVVSSPNFEKFAIHQFRPSVQHFEFYLKLAKSASSSTSLRNMFVPVVHYSVLEDSSTQTNNQNKYSNPRLRIITMHCQHTLEDMMKRKGKFQEEQLVNTMDEILRILKTIHANGLEYGMLSPSTVCFYKDEIVLGFGEIPEQEQKAPKHKEKERKDQYLQQDLRSLGMMILELAVRQNGTPEQLLKLAETKYKYSFKFVRTLKRLVDPVGSNRLKVWENESASNTTLAKKQNALSESNSYEGESFTDKISKLNEMVTEYLMRSKRVIERSENSRMRAAK